MLRNQTLDVGQHDMPCTRIEGASSDAKPVAMADSQPGERMAANTRTALYTLTSTAIQAVEETTFTATGIRERGDLQRVLRNNIAVIAPDTLVVAEEFGNWDGSQRRIDLLGIDRDANLVVVELKRDQDGGHMELQALRYAAMVARMTFQDALDSY